LAKTYLPALEEEKEQTRVAIPGLFAKHRSAAAVEELKMQEKSRARERERCLVPHWLSFFLSFFLSP
jgi:hypothetical protein